MLFRRPPEPAAFIRHLERCKLSGESAEGASMRNYAHLVILVLINLIVPISADAQKQSAKSPKIVSARTVYFDNRTGNDAVGATAVAQLRKWGRFQVVQDKKAADLIFLLSADPYHGGYIIFASGQTGTMDPNGHVQEDSVPDYNRQAPVRDVYLTVIDSSNGQNFWSDSHVWGGLLTGVNSAGERLVQKLQKQIGK